MQAITSQLNELAKKSLVRGDRRAGEKDDLPLMSRVGLRRMNAEQERSAAAPEGKELAEGIRAAADREVTVIEANAFRDAGSFAVMVTRKDPHLR